MSWLEPKCSDAHLAVAFFHLAHLLDAGLSIDDALDDVQALESLRRMRPVWYGMVSDVRSGVSLSVGMDRWPDVFSTSLKAIVVAGEASGQLTEAMHEVESLLRWQAELRSRLIGVLAYPIFAVVVLAFVVLFLFTSVVPSLADYLASGSGQLSWHTQSALTVSQILAGLTWIQLVTALLLVGAVVLVFAVVPNARPTRDRLIIKAPLIGDLLTSLWVSRYCRLVGQLYAAGVPLIDAMAQGEQAIRNRVLLRRYVSARESISRGETLMKVFADEPLMPVLFRRLVVVGESSGKLDTALFRCSEQLLRYTTCRIERIEKLTGPTMLCVVGILLLWIVVSVLSPVYQTAIEVVTQ